MSHKIWIKYGGPTPMYGVMQNQFLFDTFVVF